LFIAGLPPSRILGGILNAEKTPISRLFESNSAPHETFKMSTRVLV